MPLGGWWVRAWPQGVRPSSSSADLGPCGAHYAPTMRRQRAHGAPPQCAHYAPTKRQLYPGWGQGRPQCAYKAPTMRPLCARSRSAPTLQCASNAPTMRPVCAHSAPSPVGPAGVRAHYAPTMRPLCAHSAPPCAPTVRHLLRPLCATLCAHYAPPCAPTVRQPVRRLSSESMAALLCWQNHSCLSTLGGEYDVLALRAWRRFCVWLTPAAGA